MFICFSCVLLLPLQLKTRALQMDELQHIIKQKQELLVRESVLRPVLDYSEGMTAEEQKRYINYLADRVNAADLENRAMKLVLQDFFDRQKADAARLAKLDDMISRVESLESSRKEKDRQIAELTAKLKFANKNRFGSSRYSTEKKKASPADESDRTRDENDFDGTSSSLPENSIANRDPQGASPPCSSGKETS